MTEPTDDHYYYLARKRVRQKKRFYSHLKSFIIVNVVFSLVTFFNGEPFAWTPIILFWGMGLAFHYVKVFGLPGNDRVLTPEWEEREVQKEMDRMRARDGRRPSLPEANSKHSDELDLKELRKSYDDSELV